MRGRKDHMTANSTLSFRRGESSGGKLRANAGKVFNVLNPTARQQSKIQNLRRLAIEKTKITPPYMIFVKLLQENLRRVSENWRKKIRPASLIIGVD
jgi:hypothetical protein